MERKFCLNVFVVDPSNTALSDFAQSTHFFQRFFQYLRCLKFVYQRKHVQHVKCTYSCW